MDAFKTLQLPFIIQTDKGSEFLGKPLQAWFKENNVHFFVSENDDIKCSIVERFNRTLKTKLWRYFTHKNTLTFLDVLNDFVESYNNSYHRAIKMTPNEALNSKNTATVWNNLNPISPLTRPPKFKKGDTVRISKTRQIFKKGYLPSWSEEIFTISKQMHTEPYTYKLIDWNREELKGSFYEYELQIFSKQDEYHVIEKVLKKRKNKIFVKWRGYPDKFNSWVSDKDVRPL